MAFVPLQARAALAASLLWLCGAMGASAQGANCDVRLNPVEFERFLQITTRAEYNDTGRDFIIKWATDIRIVAHGSPTADDLETLQGVIDELNDLIEGVSISLVPKAGNIDIHFVPRERFPAIAEAAFGHERTDWSNIEAYFIYWYNAFNEIDRGGILINAAGHTETRASSIREEVTQLLGLTNDVRGDPMSIFDPDGNPLAFSPTDERMISALYCEALQPGMSAEQMRPLVASPANLKRLAL